MSARVLVVDNVDSFTFNLVQALRERGAETLVHRNDELTVAAAERLAPTHVVISPGPGRPEDAGVTLPLIRALIGRVPLLGVCLGHQALAVACGGRVTHARAPLHGKTTRVYHDGHGLFRAQVGRGARNRHAVRRGVHLDHVRRWSTQEQHGVVLQQRAIRVGSEPSGHE